MRLASLALLLLASVAAPVDAAQRLAATAFPPTDPMPPTQVPAPGIAPTSPAPDRHLATDRRLATASTGYRSSDDMDGPKLVMGGIFGGLAGLVAAGGVVRAGAGECPEFECFVPLFYAAMAGESVGVPLGVHLANGREGRLGPSLAASIAIGGAGLVGAIAGHEPRLLLAIPVLQIAAAVGLERRTTLDSP